MEKSKGKELADLAERARFLSYNCDKVEEKGYTKYFTKEEMQELKDRLANLSVRVEEVEGEKKALESHFKPLLKDLNGQLRETVSDIRAKAKYVREQCYKFVDCEGREVGYYNADGDLVESRPATADELQLTIFPSGLKTGTNG
jgi:hypothetical protein